MIYIVKQGFFESLKLKKFRNTRIDEMETQNKKSFIGPQTVEANTAVKSAMSKTIPSFFKQKQYKVRLTQICQGAMFGEDDIIIGRLASSSIICKS